MCTVFLRLFNMALLWIASYPDGCWRQQAKTSEQRQSLSTPNWLLQKLAQYGNHKLLDSAFYKRTGGAKLLSSFPDICVQGLVKVEAGTEFIGWQTRFSDEAELLWKYYESPADSYTLKITHFKPCETSQKVRNGFVIEQNARSRQSRSADSILWECTILYVCIVGPR